MELVKIPGDKVWLPDLTLYNRYVKLKKVSAKRCSCTEPKQSNLDLFSSAKQTDKTIRELLEKSYGAVNHDGLMNWWPDPLLVQTSCPIDVLYFPFDEQNCYIQFSAWAYNSQEVFYISLVKREQIPTSDLFGSVCKSIIPKLETYFPNNCEVDSFSLD